ncbi:MAG: T9SS type A sorting domain-containing protein [Bacteroidetes bacterium]|nr:T9SS type A sorting domain-containing protein [Bacteroidota bacterium]
MKKNLLLSSALLIGALSASAQITITTADVAMPTKVIKQATDNLPTVTEGSAGINQTWNMTALNSSILDSLTFISYSWIPNPNFPASNLIASAFSGTDTNYIYLTNNATGLTSSGSVAYTDFGGGSSTVMNKNTPEEVLMSFPGTYLSSTTNNYQVNTPAFYFNVDPGVGFVIDSARQRAGVKKTLLVDAWGSLTTPLGTYNVLRVKETVIRRDTTDVLISSLGGWNPVPGFTPLLAADSTTSYSFWANGVGFPLVSLKLDSTAAISEAKWLQALPTVGINEQSNATVVNVFPNPAQNQITFTVEAQKVASIQILDITGRMIDLIVVNGETVPVNTSILANGVYSYTLVGRDNVILNRGKFTIVK